ncbi:MAG TPA: thiol:disulfide interchange protein [Planctomycetaceae bacterium]|nr:thiol:disulfide interchange protein [Planctomycetaceae bacterium]
MQSQFPNTAKREFQPKRRPFFHFWRCFWLSFLVISLAYAWYCYYVPSNSIAWADSYTAAQTKATQTEKPLLLYFTAKWCVPCRIMKRNVWADEQVAEIVNAKFIPVAIEVDNPDAAGVLARYNISGSPVTILTDSSGRVIRWRGGGLGKTEFLEFLSESEASEAETREVETPGASIVENQRRSSQSAAIGSMR